MSYVHGLHSRIKICGGYVSGYRGLSNRGGILE